MIKKQAKMFVVTIPFNNIFIPFNVCTQGFFFPSIKCANLFWKVV